MFILLVQKKQFKIGKTSNSVSSCEILTVFIFLLQNVNVRKFNERAKWEGGDENGVRFENQKWWMDSYLIVIYLFIINYISILLRASDCYKTKYEKLVPQNFESWRRNLGTWWSSKRFASAMRKLSTGSPNWVRALNRVDSRDGLLSTVMMWKTFMKGGEKWMVDQFLLDCEREHLEVYNLRKRKEWTTERKKDNKNKNTERMNE